MADLGYLDDPADLLGMLLGAVVARGPGRHRHRRALRLRRARPRSAAARGTTTRPGSSSARTATCPSRCRASSSIATSAGPGRHRRTRSASGSGCSCATTPGRRARPGASLRPHRVPPPRPRHRRRRSRRAARRRPRRALAPSAPSTAPFADLGNSTLSQCVRLPRSVDAGDHADRIFRQHAPGETKHPPAEPDQLVLPGPVRLEPTRFRVVIAATINLDGNFLLGKRHVDVGETGREPNPVLRLPTGRAQPV